MSDIPEFVETSPNTWLRLSDGCIFVVREGQPLDELMGEFAAMAAAADGPPSLTDLRGAARANVLLAIDNATSSILSAYPAGERLGWDAKAAEAAAVLKAASLALAPLLAAECAAEYGAADDTTRLAQLVAKANTVSAKAAAWGTLMATLSGLRGKAFAAIAAAEDAAAVQAALDAAVAEIAGATE